MSFSAMIILFKYFPVFIFFNSRTKEFVILLPFKSSFEMKLLFIVFSKSFAYWFVSLRFRSLRVRA